MGENKDPGRSRVKFYTFILSNYKEVDNSFRLLQSYKDLLNSLRKGKVGHNKAVREYKKYVEEVKVKL